LICAHFLQLACDVKFMPKCGNAGHSDLPLRQTMGFTVSRLSRSVIKRGL
jgi:hypothetical protein